MSWNPGIGFDRGIYLAVEVKSYTVYWHPQNVG